MNFGAALKQLKIGIKIRRAAWFPDWNFIQFRDGVIYLAEPPQEWIPLHEDLLAEDWQIQVV